MAEQNIKFSLSISQMMILDIQGDCNGTKDFNQSFCRTIKRTFYRGNKENPAIEEDPFCDEDLKPSERFTMCDSGLDVSASALSLFEVTFILFSMITA